jgi:hypothetical protein
VRAALLDDEAAETVRKADRSANAEWALEAIDRVISKVNGERIDTLLALQDVFQEALEAWADQQATPDPDAIERVLDKWRRVMDGR